MRKFDVVTDRFHFEGCDRFYTIRCHYPNSSDITFTPMTREELGELAKSIIDVLSEQQRHDTRNTQLNVIPTSQEMVDAPF